MRLALVLLAASISSSAIAQSPQTIKHQAFVLPPEIGMAVVASQPECPLKFENVQLLVYLDGSGTVADSFDLRNTGTKPIRDYVIASYTSYGGMWSKGRSRSEVGKPIPPGGLAPLTGDDDVDIVPVTDELRDKFKLRNREMGGVEVFMIVRVEFTDGTVFTDEKAAKALESYFHKLVEAYSKD